MNASQYEPYDTDSIEERIAVFDIRFTELSSRYAEFSKVLDQLQSRMNEHLEQGAKMLEIARNEQEAADRKTGIAGWFSRRNQGRINAKIMGAIERDFAVLSDLQELTARNLQLVNDTGEAVRRDVKEMMGSVVHTLQSYHQAHASSLRLLGDDIELLKQLSSRAILNHPGTSEPEQRDETNAS